MAKVKFPAIFAICASAALFPVAPVAIAQDAATDEERRLQQIEQQLEDTTRNAEEIKRIVPQREKELAGLRARLIETADSLKESESLSTNIEQRLGMLESEAIIVQMDLDRRQSEISDVLAALQSLERSKPPALAISPDDAATAARAAMALSTTVPDLQTKVDELQSAIDRNALLQRDMRQENVALQQANAELDARRKILEELLRKKEEEYQQVNTRLAALEAETARLAKEATTIRELLTRLKEQEASRTRPQPSRTDDRVGTDSLERRPTLSVYNDLPAIFSQAKGKLPFPVAGRLSRKFGSRTEDGEKLEGLRIETRGGAIVTAPFSGHVAFAENLGQLGNVFILDVGENYHLIMTGLASLEISAGESVSAGEPVGYMPGNNAREELHFEIRLNREPLNPTAWFRPRERS